MVPFGTMKPLAFLNTIITLSLFASNVVCIRNLFLPRTGDISGITSSAITENLSNVTNFESLLGAGRSLAYPFSAGMLLAITTLANENNWKVSDAGFSKVLGIPREEILESYGTLLELLEGDENVTLSNTIFSFRPNFSPSEALVETLMTDVREVTWTRETWKETYNSMVEHLGNVTNEKIDTLLVPPVTKIGTPFRKTTEAVILSTFHYINGWKHPWADAELGNFYGNEGIPYLKVEASFLVAEEEDYVAVSVPLEGDTKSIVFVLPHANLTSKYFRTQGEGEDEPTDVVPFPKKWQMKKLQLKVPAFNTTDVDQYGQELEQIGMNETFCTIIKDYFGTYPYYLRPMVQVNYLDFNEDFLELASATGVAVEKFQSLFTIISEGNGEKDEKDDERRVSSKPQQNHNKLFEPSSFSILTKTSPDVDNGNGSVPLKENSENNATAAGSIEYISLTEGNDIPTLSLNRPFLWYLNDSEVGPIFFGTVENLLNLDMVENSTNPPDDNVPGTTMSPPSGDEMNGDTSNGNGNNNSTDNSSILSDFEKYYLWSCRSFTPAGPAASNKIPDGAFQGSFEETDINTTTNVVSTTSSTLPLSTTGI